MSQYEANTGVQAHKPTMIEKVKATTEGLVHKVTGHGTTHTGTTTGGTNVTPGMGGAGYPQQPGHGEPQQYTATNPGLAAQQPMGPQQGGVTGATAAGAAHPKHETMGDKLKDFISPGHHAAGTGTGTGHHTGTGVTGSTPGTAHMSTADKIKNMLPGHHHTTGAGTGHDKHSTY